MEIVDTIQTVSSPITSLAITCDNTFIIIGCENNSVQVKSLITGSDIHDLSGHNSSTVNCLATSADCEQVYVACADGKIYLYDIKSRELITVLVQQEAAISDLKISSDNSFLFSSSGVIIKKNIKNPLVINGQGDKSVKNEQNKKFKKIPVKKVFPFPTIGKTTLYKITPLLTPFKSVICQFRSINDVQGVKSVFFFIFF
jgi:WD40 repeat protein